MRLYSLKIEGLRRISNITIYFGDTTFLIGPNNAGKSTIMFAIETLLSANKRLDDKDYYSIIDPDTGEQKTITNKIILEAEFRNLPNESNSWRGFKGRLFKYDPEDSGETGILITYRKTYELGNDVIIELKSKKRHLNDKYKGCKKPQDFINLGIDENQIKRLFSEIDKNISAKQNILLEELDEIWDLEDEEEWFKNPGGIPGNVLSRLPRFILIPADTAVNHLDGNGTGVLSKMLSELFDDVRAKSDNYEKAQQYLNALSKELDPNDINSEFGKMITELNDILKCIFPESKLHANTDLSDPDKALKPTFTVEMSSNVRTTVNRQGTGMIRSAAFGLLRYRQKWISKKDENNTRSLIVAFEEPELYLHPSAANQMRDTIYNLSCCDSQIVATTHSPFMIDLSRKPRQLLNRLFFKECTIDCIPFNVTNAYKILHADDKTYVKLLLKLDDYVSRVFFTNNVIIIEGDTEDIVLRESISRLPDEIKNNIYSNYEIIKARGKASIIGLIKYLAALNIKPIVIHDRDIGIKDAEKFNKPISDLVNDKTKLFVLEECIEDLLGYKSPSNEKPYTAFKHLSNSGNDWKDLPIKIQELLKKVFQGII